MATKQTKDLVFFSEHEPEFEESRIAAEKCTKGQPLQRSWHHFTSPDDKFFSGEWEAEPGCWNISYTEHEFCQILSGKSIIRDEEGNEKHLAAGDNFVVPAGFKGQWEVLETTRKIYVIYQP